MRVGRPSWQRAASGLLPGVSLLVRSNLHCGARIPAIVLLLVPLVHARALSAAESSIPMEDAIAAPTIASGTPARVGGKSPSSLIPPGFEPISLTRDSKASDAG